MIMIFNVPFYMLLTVPGLCPHLDSVCIETVATFTPHDVPNSVNAYVGIGH